MRIVIIPLAACAWTLLAHVLDETDHCSLAQSCAHDGAEVRGLAPDQRTVRLFLDACDLHEYNCDHNTNFKLVIVSSTTAQTVNCDEPGEVAEEKQTSHKSDITETNEASQPNTGTDNEQNQDNDSTVQEPNGEQIQSNPSDD